MLSEGLGRNPSVCVVIQRRALLPALFFEAVPIDASRTSGCSLDDHEVSALRSGGPVAIVVALPRPVGAQPTEPWIANSNSSHTAPNDEHLRSFTRRHVEIRLFARVMFFAEIHARRRNFFHALEFSRHNPDILGMLGYAYAEAGRRGEAQSTLNELKALARKQYVSPFDIGGVLIGLGDNDEAFKWLNKACTERVWIMGFIKVEPIFDHLKSDHRYADLVSKIGLPH